MIRDFNKKNSHINRLFKLAYSSTINIYNVKTKIIYYFLQYLMINQYGLLLYFGVYNFIFYKCIGNMCNNTKLSICLVIIHNFTWNFFDFVWHSDCHGYFKPSRILKELCQLYLFFFWGGMDYAFLIFGHLKHHAYMDTNNDAQKVHMEFVEVFSANKQQEYDLSDFQYHTTALSNFKINQDTAFKRYRVRRFVYIILCILLCIYNKNIALMLEWTCTTWQFNVKKLAHYSRCFRNDNNILRVTERSVLENALIMYMVLDDFNHYEHHKNGRVLQLNIKKYFDGHSIYFNCIKPFKGVLYNR